MNRFPTRLISPCVQVIPKKRFVAPPMLNPWDASKGASSSVIDSLLSPVESSSRLHTNLVGSCSNIFSFTQFVSFNRTAGSIWLFSHLFLNRWLNSLYFLLSYFPIFIPWALKEFSMCFFLSWVFIFADVKKSLYLSPQNNAIKSLTLYFLVPDYVYSFGRLITVSVAYVKTAVPWVNEIVLQEGLYADMSHTTASSSAAAQNATHSPSPMSSFTFLF